MIAVCGAPYIRASRSEACHGRRPATAHRCGAAWAGGRPRESPTQAAARHGRNAGACGIRAKGIRPQLNARLWLMNPYPFVFQWFLSKKTRTQAPAGPPRPTAGRARTARPAICGFRPAAKTLRCAVGFCFFRTPGCARLPCFPSPSNRKGNGAPGGAREGFAKNLPGRVCENPAQHAKLPGPKSGGKWGSRGARALGEEPGRLSALHCGTALSAAAPCFVSGNRRSTMPSTEQGHGGVYRDGKEKKDYCELRC